MLYNIGLISVIRQNELTMGAHSLPLEPPSHLLPTPISLGDYRAPFESTEAHSESPLAIYLHILVYMHARYSLHSSHPLSLLLHPCPQSVLYVCVPTAALRTGSSVPSFWIPHMCINIQYLFFSFRLTSHCIVRSSFIRLIRTDSSVLLFMAE